MQKVCVLRAHISTVRGDFWWAHTQLNGLLTDQTKKEHHEKHNEDTEQRIDKQNKGNRKQDKTTKQNIQEKDKHTVKNT